MAESPAKLEERSRAQPKEGLASMAALRSSAQAERSRAKPTPIRTLTGQIGQHRLTI
jgi:hypothetical protein